MNLFSGIPPKLGEFEACLTQDDLPFAFGVGEKQLLFHLYSPKAPKYKTFTIPKASGEDRLIAVPPPVLMNWQRILCEFLTKRYVRKPSVHGFVNGYSICSNAKVHINRHLVLNIDIRDFFPSIHYGRVRGMFARHPFNFPHAVASTLARLCTWNGALPQGAPTSPIISNLVCRGMDNDLWRLLKKSPCKYTRYADDITISTNHQSFPEQFVLSHDAMSGTVHLGETLKSIFAKHHFSINEKKLRIQSSAFRQVVTGLTVNERVNVTRKYIQTLRSIICEWRVKGESITELKFRQLDAGRRLRHFSAPTLHDHVDGKLEFLKMVRGEDDPIYTKYAISARRLSQQIRTPIICKQATDILAFMKETLWTVLAYDAAGDFFPMGTAYTLTDRGIVSARHVFDDNKDDFPKWTLMRACKPFDEYPITGYKNDPAIDMTLLSSIASPNAKLRMTAEQCKYFDNVILFGFPNWHTQGDEPIRMGCTITQLKPISMVDHIAIDQTILSGASGGPALNTHGDVVGTIVNSKDHNIMPNSFISIKHLDSVQNAPIVPL
jgi:RNA-directed DNA polymerase